MATKGKLLQFRADDDEAAHVRDAAKDGGFKSLSDYLRSVVLHPTVVVVGYENVVIIPSTVTLPYADDELKARIEQIVGLINSQAGSAPAPPADPPAPPAPLPPAHSQPATPSPSEPGMVGASGAPPAPPPPPGDGPLVGADAGGQPGSAETCAECGGTNGRHQGFCSVMTGVPAVTEKAPTEAPPAQEDFTAFAERRIGEQEAQGVSRAVALAVVEVEWGQLLAGGGAVAEPGAPPPPVAQQPCGSCGAMKDPATQCKDCGRRPEI